MLKNKLSFPASDSTGVRSMANFFTAENGIKIAIDPGAALAPKRYGLPPHQLEIEELEKRLRLIEEGLEDSNVVLITHYHRDHYPFEDFLIDSLKGKTVVMKHPEVEINYSQKLRGMMFLRELKKRGVVPIVSNGIEMRFGELKIVMDGLMWHGEPKTMLGKVASFYIEDGEDRYYFASDSQGPIDPEGAAKICRRRPSLLYISGPPVYLSKEGSSASSAGLKNLEAMIREKCFNELIVDHHFAREYGYHSRIEALDDIGRKHGVRVYDVPDFTGVERRPLESMRNILYKEEAE